ncbi:hypothetical protein PVAP13_7NG388584 [Panicum virgatum]|uniref:Uncharacterized protein n=1 Tax=Panicum virgatum TaxID=38727 RepID=A0A8T0Q4Y8_PANVG|nr:hypothetical protein PVAP13_7NG388584 [Panicum virgatum]
MPFPFDRTDGAVGSASSHIDRLPSALGELDSLNRTASALGFTSWLPSSPIDPRWWQWEASRRCLASDSAADSSRPGQRLAWRAPLHLTPRSRRCPRPRTRGPAVGCRCRLHARSPPLRRYQGLSASSSEFVPSLLLNPCCPPNHVKSM